MKICLAERASVNGVTISLGRGEMLIRLDSTGSPCDKVENKTKSDADWQSRQCASKECQEDERETEPDQDGDEAGKGGVPVAIAACLAHQDGVEDEITESKFYTSVLFIFFHLLSSQT